MSYFLATYYNYCILHSTKYTLIFQQVGVVRSYTAYILACNARRCTSVVRVQYVSSLATCSNNITSSTFCVYTSPFHSALVHAPQQALFIFTQPCKANPTLQPSSHTPRRFYRFLTILSPPSLSHTRGTCQLNIQHQ